MALHLLRMISATALIVLCTMLPFLPGRYDGLAVALSGMAQVFGFVGLLLVPAAAFWLAFNARRRGATGVPARRDGAAAAVLVVAAFVGLIVALTAVVFSGFSLAIVAVALWASFVWKGARRRARASPTAPRLTRPTAVALMLVPIAVTTLQFSLAGPVSEWSRGRAIRNSARLIADIETYREAHGRYPPSLLALWPDYHPGLIGVAQYRYEPSGDAYNLVFEHPSLRLGTREIVVYNPRDEQVATSHAVDLLEYAGQALEVRRGYLTVHPANAPHWKYFLFD
ncbi:MAG TPA: hypothetical protein VLE53_04150 [Gemmatimonadaceae bacterium]|nr:hypothetical protein [Gemmatimonadaceae bacterium]